MRQQVTTNAECERRDGTILPTNAMMPGTPVSGLALQADMGSKTGVAPVDILREKTHAVERSSFAMSLDGLAGESRIQRRYYTWTYPQDQA